MTKNPLFDACTKHIELSYHLVWEKVTFGNLVTKYIPSSLYIADILTKSLSKKSFKEFQVQLGVHHLPLPSLRGLDKVFVSLTKNNKFDIDEDRGRKQNKKRKSTKYYILIPNGPEIPHFMAKKLITNMTICPT